MEEASAVPLRAAAAGARAPAQTHSERLGRWRPSSAGTPVCLPVAPELPRAEVSVLRKPDPGLYTQAAGTHFKTRHVKQTYVILHTSRADTRTNCNQLKRNENALTALIH